MNVNLYKVNDVYLKVECDYDVFMELWEYFTFETNVGNFTKKVKKFENWDGKIRLLSKKTRQIYVGLLNEIRKWCKNNGYSISIDSDLKYWEKRWEGDIIKDLLPSRNGELLEPHDYQITGVTKSLNLKRLILQSPTSSGKSLIIYSIIRYLEDIVSGKILLIVPRTSLIKQMFGDFKEYCSLIDNWNVEEKLHMIYSGQEKTSDKKIYISTWQSLISKDIEDNYFDRFNAVIVDEGHMAQANSIKGIMEKLKDCPYRICTTGTLHEKDMKINLLTLEGLFGPVYKTSTTKELMDRGIVSYLKINCIELKYPEKDREFFKTKTVIVNDKKVRKRKSYSEEIDYIVSHERRNDFIMNLAEKLNGNTLILFSYKDKHAVPFYENIKERSSKNIFYISGDMDVFSREDKRDEIQKTDNNIILATYGVFQMGVNIPNLQNLIFAHPYKGQIINLQSIGRILRLDGKENKAVLFDLIDDLHWKKQQNYTLIHGIRRLEIYSGEKFDYKIHEKEI